MKYFIGIVPPPEIHEQLQKIKHEGHSEPHITVKAQSGLDADLLWIENVKKVADSVRPFDVNLSEPRYFGQDVLFLGVESLEVYELHRKLVKAVNPAPQLSAQYHELDHYVPHLTLAQRSYGYSFEQLEEIKNETLSALYPYPSFEVTYIRIYRQENRGEPYKKYMDLRLNG